MPTVSSQGYFKNTYSEKFLLIEMLYNTNMLTILTLRGSHSATYFKTTIFSYIIY